MNNKDAYDDLKITLRVLNSLNIQHWATCGLLLGLLREGDFIPHDYDIDIALYDADNEHKALLAQLERNKFNVYKVRRAPHTHGLTVKTRRNIKVDFLYWYTNNTELYHLIGHSNYYVYPKELFFPLQYATLNKLKIPIPKHAEQVIELHYGKNWRTPNKKWSWAKDPGCLRNHIGKTTTDANG